MYAIYIQVYIYYKLFMSVVWVRVCVHVFENRLHFKSMGVHLFLYVTVLQNRLCMKYTAAHPFVPGSTDK